MAEAVFEKIVAIPLQDLPTSSNRQERMHILSAYKRFPVRFMNIVLFLCTGNYYRSRFAEELFNFRAVRYCPGWAAASRGLALERGAGNVGPISTFAAEALLARGVGFDALAARFPRAASVDDLAQADHVVALDYGEHYPLLREKYFSQLSLNDVARIEYWDVADVDRVAPDAALALIAERVDDLSARLDGQRRLRL